MYEQDMDTLDADDAVEMPALSDGPEAFGATASKSAGKLKDKDGTRAQHNARARLEEVREERALRKAIYDDLYYLDGSD